MMKDQMLTCKLLPHDLYTPGSYMLCWLHFKVTFGKLLFTVKHYYWFCCWLCGLLHSVIWSHL